MCIGIALGSDKLWQSKIHLQLLVIQKVSNLASVIQNVSKLVSLIDIKSFKPCVTRWYEKCQTFASLGDTCTISNLLSLGDTKVSNLVSLGDTKVSKLVSLGAACSSRFVQFSRAYSVLQIEYTVCGTITKVYIILMFHVLCATMQTPVVCCSTIAQVINVSLPHSFFSTFSFL